jgi:hypothetical protein
MTNRILWHITACVTALTLFPTSSRAQSPATTFDELRLVVKDGNDVVVTDSNGRRTRGRVATVGASSLDLAVEKPRFLILREHSHQGFTDSAVRTVTRIDSRREGAFIGFLAGFVSVVVAGCNSGDALECDYARILGGPIFGGLGAAIGMLIDGSINEVVYRSDARVGPVTITLSPALTTKSAGASLNLRF